MWDVILRSCQRLVAPFCDYPGVLARLIAAILLTALVAGCDKASNAGIGGPGDKQDSASNAVVNLNGERIDPFQSAKTNRTIVLVFLGVECPISNRYVPELRRLHNKFTEQKVGWWFVYPGTGYSLQAIRQHVREFNVPGDVACDPQLALARRAQVRMTPEVAVFLADGKLMYHGRIDDRFPELTVERPAPTRRDLEETLDAILAGKSLAPVQTQAVGCFIPGLP